VPARKSVSYVFDRGAGVPMVVETVSHLFARLVAGVGLGDVRMHDLRHAFATRLFERGVHPKVVSEALGHASIAITLDTYSHVMRRWAGSRPTRSRPSSGRKDERRRQLGGNGAPSANRSGRFRR
jgi:integrase